MERYLFRLPDVGEGIVEAEITAWHVKPGDIVRQDQPLLDVTTHKATMDITSPVEGRVLAIHGNVKSMAVVGADLVEFELLGSSLDAVAPAAPEPLYSAAFRKHHSSDSDIVTILENDRVRINFQSGEGRRAFVVFAGLAERMAGIMQTEFKNLAKIDCDIYYVVDLSRQGFHSNFDDIRYTLTEHILNRGTKDVVTLGNSMGGIGAFMFPEVLPNCQTAIAFGALTSVHPGVVPFEDRVPAAPLLRGSPERDAITHLQPHIKYYGFYGTRCVPDLRHVNRLIAAGGDNIALYLVSGCGHNVAKFLRPRLPLSDLLDAACHEGTSGIARLMRKVRYRKLVAPIPEWRIQAARFAAAVRRRLTGLEY